MSRDRLIFLLSFAFIAVIAIMLFTRHDTGPAPATMPVPGNAPAQEGGAAQNKPLDKKPEFIKPETPPPETGKIGVSILFTTRSSIVQFLNPGMFIDIIYSSDASMGFGSITLTLINHIRVLEIGRGPEGKPYNEVGELKPNTPIEMLLEMTPREAEILTFAQESGLINIAIEGSNSYPQNSTLAEQLLESHSPDSFQSIIATYMINSLFPEKAEVKIISTPKGFIVSGKVLDQQTNEKISQILTMLSSNKGVVNLLEEGLGSNEVLTAKRNIKGHSHLEENDFQWVKIPPDQLNPQLITRSPETEKNVNDYITKKEISRGSFITHHDVILEEEFRNLAQKKPEKLPLAPCHVAVPFEISSDSPIVPFLGLGLRVDTRFISLPDVGLPPVSLLLFKNMRIVSIQGPQAVPPQLAPPPHPGTIRPVLQAPIAAALAQPPRHTPPNFNPALKPGPMPIEIPPPIKVFLEMTPRQAEIFSFAEHSGLLTLELSACNGDDSRELMELDRPSNYEDLVDLLLESDSYENFRSILVTYMLRSIFPVCLKVDITPRGVIVEGKVPDPQMADKILEILAKLVPGADKAIINLLDVQPQQVLLKVRVYEVSKDIISRIGVNWDVLYDTTKQALGLSSVFPIAPPPQYLLTARGQFGKYDLTALLDMLEEDVDATLLAAPNITTISGQTAHFFSGGEFPILIPQGTGLLGLTTVTVLYKKYGVLLDFTPDVGLNGLITLHVIPEVSTLDKANSVEISGFLIPALLTRRADTKVRLWPGQTYVIGGLYYDQQLNINDNLYGLNRIPVLGALFNSNRYEDHRKELLFIVTPYLVNDTEVIGNQINDAPACEICMPGDNSQPVPVLPGQVAEGPLPDIRTNYPRIDTRPKCSLKTVMPARP